MCALCRTNESMSRVSSVGSNVSEVESVQEDGVSLKTLLHQMNACRDTLDEVNVSFETSGSCYRF